MFEATNCTVNILFGIRWPWWCPTWEASGAFGLDLLYCRWSRCLSSSWMSPSYLSFSSIGGLQLREDTRCQVPLRCQAWVWLWRNTAALKKVWPQPKIQRNLRPAMRIHPSSTMRDSLPIPNIANIRCRNCIHTWFFTDLSTKKTKGHARISRVNGIGRDSWSHFQRTEGNGACEGRGEFPTLGNVKAKRIGPTGLGIQQVVAFVTFLF